MLWAGCGWAQSPSANDVRAVQYALNRTDRYPSGPVDGIIGPKTRAAVAAFAGSRPLEEAFWPVAAQIADLIWWRAPWTEATEHAVRSTLAARTKRVPYIRERRVWQGRRARVACVRIRGGAGPIWLHMPLRQGWVSPSPRKPPVATLVAAPPSPVPPETSALWCRLGYVPE